MAELTEGSTEIEATPAEVMEVLMDFESYPTWAGIKRIEVMKRDSKGRGSEVSMEVSQMGFSASYTLSYRYKPKQGGMSWTTKEASGAVKDITGDYDLQGDGDTTKVTYRMSVEQAVPVPGFVKRQVERMVVNTALGGLKKRVESR